MPDSSRKTSPAFQFQDQALQTLLAKLNTSEQGLSATEAQIRLLRHGENQIVFHRARSPWLLFFNEFRALFPLLLLVAALLAFWAHWLSPSEGYNLIGWALSGVVMLNAIMSFLQNYKVERLMLSFLDYIPKSVTVLRDGKAAQHDAKYLVPGDVLLVQEGDKISADGVILEFSQMVVDESILSGESLVSLNTFIAAMRSRVRRRRCWRSACFSAFCSTAAGISAAR